MNKIILTVICLSLLSGSIIAADCIGSAVIPRFKLMDFRSDTSRYTWDTLLFLSNVSSDTTDVYLKLYKQDGDLLTTDARIESFNTLDFCTTNTYCTASFSIATNQTIMLKFRPSTDTNISQNLIYGYGVVEWDRASGASPVSLIGDGFMWYDMIRSNDTQSSFGEHFDLGSKSTALF
jgi:hypothetical protein